MRAGRTLTVLTCGLLLAVGAPAVPGASAAAPAEDGIPTKTPVKHFITLMQENHTFDNYFGTYPGADGIPAGVCMPRDPLVPDGSCVEPFRMEGLPALDLGHSRSAFDEQYRDGAMDGFVSAQGADSVMGYYDDADLPYYWNIAEEFVLFDRFFSSSGGGSLQNHFYWLAGAPGTNGESIPEEGVEVPTIFDRLDAAGVSWKFYIQNYDPTIDFRALAGKGDRASQVVWAPVLTMPRYVSDPEFMAHIVDLDEFYVDLEEDTLPSVVYLVPSGASEHPPGSLRAGQRFVQSLINALVRSSYWDSSAFTWTYDDWGGWYDHVPPPQVDAYGYGFRVPALLVSAFAKRGYVDSTELDFTSIPRFIADNWGLAPVGKRGAAANTFADAFDFAQPPRDPFFVSPERIPPAQREQPSRPVLYVAYGSSIALTVAFILIALAVQRWRRHRRW